MKLKKCFSAVLAALSVIAMYSCDKVKNTESNPSLSSETTETSDVSATTDTTAATEPMTTFTQAAVSTQKISKKDFYGLYEAEYAKLSDGLRVSFERDDYNGDGYVTGFRNGSTVTFGINAVSAQHYDLSFCIASAAVTDCGIKLNGNDLTSFKTQEGGAFTYITIYGVFLEKGDSDVELSVSGENVDLDYLKVAESEVHSEKNSKPSASPVVKKADENVKKLKKFLADNYGKYTITGQNVADADNKEIELVYQTTGKYPVIRFSAIKPSQETADVDAIAAWDEKGGISFVSWYWVAPPKKSSTVAAETDFSLAEAVTDEKIAELSQDKIKSLVKKKKISEQCSLLISDIDAMAEKLKILSDKGIAIMWRPLPLGGRDAYWWGADGTDAYKWLWDLLYKRMTEYHKLNNLLWVWNGQSEESLVDKNTFDIASAGYFKVDAKDYGDCFSEPFAALQKYVGKDKILALSDCGCVPDMDISFRDNAVWSFFGLANGDHIIDAKGNLSERYISKDALIKVYNSEGTLTLDEYTELTKN